MGITSVDFLELADGLEHAARVAWRWLRSDESPWDRHVTLRMVGSLSRAAQECREAAKAPAALPVDIGEEGR